MIRIIAVLSLLILSSFAEITHENQLGEKKLKVWNPLGNDASGEYIALEGDHTGTASIHIRVYAEEESLLLWFVHISQNDLAVKPEYKVYPKYVRTRTHGTWKADNKVEYLRFVSIGSEKGIMFGDQFYKKQTGDNKQVLSNRLPAAESNSNDE